jgi:predicted secreted hydrolase
VTQDEQFARLGKTKWQYKEARAKLGAIKDRHAELAAELRKFLLSIEQEPRKVYVLRGPRGSLQTALETPEARYFYSTALADKLTLEAVGEHLEEYRATFDLVEDRRRSLIDQGDDDPGVTE